jgi:superfamily II DNA or RNA helicase
MALWPIHSCYQRGKRALFVARGRELVNQFCGHLKSLGVPHGVIMRGKPTNLEAPVQVASKDTLVSWAMRRQEIDLPSADLVVIDECHESLALCWQALIKYYHAATVIGLTATPTRSDGRGLGDLYGGMVEAIPTSQLIAGGFLVPTKVYAPYKPDLKGVPTSNGDYAPGALSTRMNRPQLVGDIVDHWKRLGQDRQTIVWASGIDHSIAIRDQFVKAGIKAEHLDGETDTDLRDAMLERLASGETRIVCNYGVLVQGVDIPVVGCGVLARPTKSFIKYRQAIGRLKRPFPGKEYAILLDHAGCVHTHGMPDNDVKWSLDTSQRIQDVLKDKRKSGEVAEPITCPQCFAVFTASRICPECGRELVRRGKARVAEQGMLHEINQQDQPNPAMTWESKIRYWHHCLAVMAHKGRTAGAAAHMFRGKFGDWPNNIDPQPRKMEWRLKVADLYPQYLRGRQPA